MWIERDKCGNKKQKKCGKKQTKYGKKHKIWKETDKRGKKQ